MKRDHKYGIRLFMLLSGFILLFSVIVPHHHHEDGGICIHLFDQADDHESDDHQHDSAHHQHDCDCSGHNIAFNTTILPGHSSEEDATLFLMPLYTLLEYVYPPEITVINSLFYSDRTVYIESLHDTWITVATGLRAPPVLVG